MRVIGTSYVEWNKPGLTANATRTRSSSSAHLWPRATAGLIEFEGGRLTHNQACRIDEVRDIHTTCHDTADEREPIFRLGRVF